MLGLKPITLHWSSAKENFFFALLSRAYGYPFRGTCTGLRSREASREKEKRQAWRLTAISRWRSRRQAHC